MTQPTDLLTTVITNAVRQAVREELDTILSGLAATDINDPDELLTTGQVAEMTGLSENTLRRWRCDHDPRAPKHLKAGGRVRYRRSDINTWLDAA